MSGWWLASFLVLWTLTGALGVIALVFARELENLRTALMRLQYEVQQHATADPPEYTTAAAESSEKSNLEMVAVEVGHD